MLDAAANGIGCRSRRPALRVRATWKGRDAQQGCRGWVADNDWSLPRLMARGARLRRQACCNWLGSGKSYALRAGAAVVSFWLATYLHGCAVQSRAGRDFSVLFRVILIAGQMRCHRARK